MEQKNSEAFEVVVVKLKDGVAMIDFVKADKELEVNFVSKQKGFLKREVVVSKDSKQLFVINHWATLEDAEAAFKAFMNDPYAMKRMSMSELVLFDHYVTGPLR